MEGNGPKGIEIPFKEERTMTRSRITAISALIVILSIAALYQQEVRARGGAAGAVCTLSQTGCIKSMVLAEAIPSVIVAPTSAPATLEVPADLFITATSCGAECADNFPISAEISVAVHSSEQPISGSPITVGAISTHNNTTAEPNIPSLGLGFNAYVIPVTIPAGTPSGLYSAVESATVTFADGLTLTSTIEQTVCLAEEAAGQPGKPRLDVRLLTDAFPHCAPGDQCLARYRITNNDPVKSVKLAGIADSKQIALRPSGGNESQGVYSIANPFGDDFPITLGSAECLALSNRPYTQGEIREQLLKIKPGRSRVVEVSIRPYGTSATGSCSESTLRVEGTFAGGAPARGCAGMAVFADTSVKSQTCGSSVNDCNGNKVPDADDIASGVSKDQNFNGTPDECEQGAPLITEPVQISPSFVEPGQTIHVKVSALDDRAVMSVLANGASLRSQDGKVWEGDIASSSEAGPQSVFAMAEDADHKIATHIGVYETRRIADFTIETLDTAKTVSPGGMAEFRVSVAGPTSNDVSLSLTGMPPGASATFSQGALIPAPGQRTESRLTISTSQTTQQGTYTLTLKGSNGKFAHEASLTLVVQRSFDFSLQPLTQSQAIVPGGSAQFIVAGRLVSGTAEPVTMSVEGLPQAASGWFSISLVIPALGGASPTVLTVDTTLAISPGNYSITIVGTSGQLRRELRVTLTVESTFGGFELVSSESSIVLYCEYYGYDCYATIEITVVLLSGSVQPVFLTAYGVPAGLQFSLNPVTPGASTTLTVQSDVAPPAGTYRVTVVGTSGSMIRTLSFDLIVN